MPAVAWFEAAMQVDDSGDEFAVNRFDDFIQDFKHPDHTLYGGARRVNAARRPPVYTDGTITPARPQFR